MKSVIQIILALLVSIPLQLISQVELIDSLKVVVRQQEDGNEKLKNLLTLTSNLNYSDIKSAKNYCQEAMDLAKKLDNQELLGEAYLQYAQNFDFENADSSQFYQDLAEVTWEAIDYKLGIGKILIRKAMDLENQGQFQNSMRTFLDALDLYEAMDDKRLISSTNVLIGGLLISMDQGQNALEYIEKARENTFEYGTIDDQAIFLLILTDAYEVLEDDSKIIETAEKLKTIALREQFYNDAVTSFSSIGDVYLKQGNFPKAKKEFDEAVYYGNLMGDNFFISRAARGLGKYYLATKEFDKAIEQFKKLEVLKEDPELMTLLNDVNLEMSEAYFGAKKHEKAYLSLLEYSQVRDSIYTEESRTIAQEIGAKYELDKKEEAIAKQEREQNILLLILAFIILGVIGLAYAYRKIKSTNSLLNERNKEKEYLIKEIHHRVKNNLQVLSSLLNLQSDYIQDPSALSAVNEGKNRVQSMALLHQKLYTGNNLAAVDMSTYIGEFTDYLIDTYGREDEIKIESHIDIKLLDIDTAVPIGLIVNELVTNSLKYAFPGSKKGIILVHLGLNEQEELILQVSDNGVGKNAIKQENSTSFGTDLVKILSKKLKGVIQKDYTNGCKTTLTFKKFQLS